MKRGRRQGFDFVLVTGLLTALAVWFLAGSMVGADRRNSSGVIFFDVGQGDSALISLPESKQILIDTGDRKEVLEKIEKNMPAFDRKIEYLVLSHADSDHVGMALEIMQSFKVEQVVVGPSHSDSRTYQKIEEYIKENNVSRKQVGRGDKICALENACMEFLSPEIDQKNGSTNEMSLVFRFDYGENELMFTGDAEQEIQNKIAEKMEEEALKSDYLKVAHHGSKESVDSRFLDEVKPALAIISVGKNSYGHPTKEAIDRLEEKNIKILRTDQIGDIKFSF